MIAQKYEKTLNKVQPYIFCNAKSLPNFNLIPLRNKISDELIIDCTKVSSAFFLKQIIEMDSIAFGGQGMAMDKWVLYDCSAMPGAIVGFAIQDKRTWRPISMYIAIPTLEKDHFFGHNLSSLNSHLGGQYPGLGLLTKILAIKIFKMKYQYGATQWGSHALHIHSKLSSLKLITSFTPNHTYKNSLTYLATYTDENLEKVLAGNDIDLCDTSFEIESSDDNMHRSLQHRIESGDEFFLSGKPIHRDGKIYYSIFQGKG